jgi:quinol monooxygenase YgiN
MPAEKETPMPVVVTAVFTPVAGEKDRLVEALRTAIAEVHQEEGCELYAIHDAEDGTITMIEKWDSAELLDAHGAGEAVARLNASVEPLIAKPILVTRMTPIEAGTQKQGLL